MNELILSVALAVTGSTGPVALNTVKEAAAPRMHWISAISGAEWKIRQDGDALYLERLLSEAALREQHSTSLELHRRKQGYKGVERQVVGAAYTNQSGREASYKCTFEWPAELVMRTGSRIEIRVLSPPDNAAIDFRKCTVNKSRVWHTAVWVAE